MNNFAMLDRLNAISAEIADTTDTVLAVMTQAHETMHKLNALQTGVQHAISLAIGDLRHSPELIPVEFQQPDVAKPAETSQNPEASRHGPQAQDSRETVTPAGGLVGGVGDGTDAGEAGSSERTAQSVQAVAETAPVEPGAAPDASATDRVLALWETGELTANEITEQTFIGSSVVLRILRKARSVGDPRVVRGDLRKAEAAEAQEKLAQARDAERAAAAAPPEDPPAAATKPALAPPGPHPDAGSVYEIHPTKYDTIRPDEYAIGITLASVDLRAGTVEYGGKELKISGAPVRVILKLNDQRVHTEADLVAAGRYVSANVFRRNLNDIQRSLLQIDLHIVEFVSGGFQLRSIRAVAA